MSGARKRRWLPLVVADVSEDDALVELRSWAESEPHSGEIFMMQIAAQEPSR